MSQNPETTFTNRIRKKLLARFPTMKIYKHSDRFNGGIVDLHLVMPYGNTCWIEVKYIKKMVNKNKVKITELQVEYLKEHWECGIPAYVLIGVDKRLAWYSYKDFDGYVYMKDVEPDDRINQLIYHMEGMC